MEDIRWQQRFQDFYDSAKCEAVLQSVAPEYLPMLSEWQLRLMQEIAEEKG
uniref:Uncharacterized protein n=1 Tax=Rheinheimera sp. BAL341 TaxID=1708203 RepID=A0A486XKJ5_9GAMM